MRTDGITQDPMPVGGDEEFAGHALVMKFADANDRVPPVADGRSGQRCRRRLVDPVMIPQHPGAAPGDLGAQRRKRRGTYDDQMSDALRMQVAGEVPLDAGEAYPGDAVAGDIVGAAVRDDDVDTGARQCNREVCDRRLRTAHCPDRTGAAIIGTRGVDEEDLHQTCAAADTGGLMP